MMEFENGQKIKAKHQSAEDNVVGLDAEGDLIAVDISNHGGKRYVSYYLLTPCCQATATGTEFGIACRGCYEEGYEEYGMEVGLGSIAVMRKGVKL